MNYLPLFGLAILVVGLVNDYKRDEGRNVRAKVFHAICLATLIVSYTGSFRILASWIRNFERAKGIFSVDVGLVPGQLHFIFYLLHSVLAMVVIVVAYGMIKRNDRSRKLLIRLLPFLAFLEVFSFYRGWLSDGDDLGVNHAMIVLTGFLVIGGLASIIIAIYSSRMMRIFFTVGQGQLEAESEK